MIVAEVARKGLVLIGRQILVAEDDHQEVLERLHDLRERFLVERLAQIDAGDFAAAGARKSVRRRSDGIRGIGRPATIGAAGPALVPRTGLSD